ncbi:hypothetical protein [Allorhizocola rhizosphaerae]|uniref:hypothetical protein n=1 Tax=Allorhizocola rhizosphaerae TaxID=1872709 RepID=UPI000E3DC9F1|nr:hypothetical protein [Allorhizocola rhizosphaerae]
MRGVLRHLDEVIVPRLGRGLARVAGWGRSGRWRLRVITALALAGSAAVLVTVVWASHSKAPGGRAPAAKPVVHVGVAQGQSIPTYLATSRSELKTLLTQTGPAAPAETYALVSLRTYLAADRLTPVLGGVSVAEVYARVQLPNAQTQIVKIPAFRLPDDVFAGMQKVATRKEAEANEFKGLAAKLSETVEAEGRLRQTYLVGAATAAAEAAAYRSGCSCVYAAVVRATPAALDQIAARPEVRAVDPAPEVLRLDQAVFLAPLPEQQDIVPSSAPAPPQSPTPRPASPKPTPSSVVPSVSPVVSASPMPSIEPRR